MSFKLIVISPPTDHAHELKLLCRLFENGLQVFHIRKPGLSKKDLRKYIEEIPSRFHRRLVIHSHPTLLKEFELKGLHLTERTRIKKVSSFYGPKKHSLSASFHSIAAINKSKRRYDHVFLSPVFNSISKKNYRSSFTELALEIFLKEHRNVIALGGTEPATIKKIQELGFAGAATLGFVWESKDPPRAYQQLISKIK